MEIPKVEQGKFVVVRADYNTGIILNNDNSYYLNRGNDYYIVYDSFEEALKFAKHEVKKEKLEVLIYDFNSEIMEVIRP